jgi:hypothetical protein
MSERKADELFSILPCGTTIFEGITTKTKY